jgi:hypothetical protein
MRIQCESNAGPYKSIQHLNMLQISYTTNTNIGKSNTYASQQACFLCSSACNAELGSFASNVQGMLSTDSNKAICMHIWVFAWQHGENASHSPLHVHGRPSYMHYRRLHKCNAGVQNVPQYMEKCIKLYMIHGVSTRIAAL